MSLACEAIWKLKEFKLAKVAFTQATAIGKDLNEIAVPNDLKFFTFGQNLNTQSSISTNEDFGAKMQVALVWARRHFITPLPCLNFQ
jgi:hypothetical protein